MGELSSKRPSYSKMKVHDSRPSHEDRLVIERAAAVRSMKTNLVLISFFMVSTLVMLLPSMKWETFYYIFSFSLNKSLLPLVTMVVNFSPVRGLQKHMWKTFCKK